MPSLIDFRTKRASHFASYTARVVITFVPSLAVTFSHIASDAETWQAGVVLDGASTFRHLELGARDRGLGLEHSDLLLRSVFNEYISGEAILGFHTEDRKLKNYLENAWVRVTETKKGRETW